MTISAADPSELDVFTTSAPPSRGSASAAAQAGWSFGAGVIANCGGRGVSLTNFPAVIELLSNMSANEAFVQGVADALRAADASYRGGVVAVPNTAIGVHLEAGGYRTVTHEVQIRAAELLGAPPTSGFVDDPICAATGNFIHADLDLAFPGTSASLNVHRFYNSLGVDRVGAFGPGWSSVFDVELELRVEIGVVVALLADGARVTFNATPDGGWAASGCRELRLGRVDQGWELVSGADGMRRWGFDAAGACTGWRVNRSVVTAERDRRGRIVRLTEQRSGRAIDVTWTRGRITTLLSDDGRRAVYTYSVAGESVEAVEPVEPVGSVEVADTPVLTRAETRSGWFDYAYDGRLLIRATDPDGVSPFVNVFDDAGRVIEQTSPFGRVTRYRYEIPGSTVITDEAGVRQAMVHDRRGNLTAVVDADGSVMRLTYDDHDRVVKVVAKSGAEWRHEFDEITGDLIRRRDPDGLSQSWTWDDAGRTTSETDRAGAVTTFEYDGDHVTPSRVVGPDGSVATADLDEWGRPAVITDPDGVVTRFSWDRDGQLLATVDGAGNATTFEFDGTGLLRRLVDPTGVTAELDLDVAGRVSTRRLGDELATYEHTAAGRVCGGSEPGGAVWAATFGPHGALESITDAIGATTRYRYDTHGNVVEVTAADGATFRQEFDGVGRLVAIVDPTGATARKRYDRHGHLVGYTDAEGRTMQRTVDAFGRTLTSTGPDGAVTVWTYHPNGEIASVTQPDGRVWTTEIDVFGRVIAVIDPVGGRATRSYSPGGRLLARTSPMGRRETFEYDTSGRCVAGVGPDGTRRDVTLDGRGRITAMVQAGGVGDAGGDAAAVEVRWDRQGRLAGYDSDRGGRRFERDPGGRVVAAIDATGTATGFAYDERGFLAAAVDPAGGEATYGYDGRGRLTSQTMPGGRTTTWAYGAAGHAERMIDPAGVTTEWSRDASGMVTGASRGGTGWTRTLDAAGREVERAGLDGSVLGEYGYDAAGRLTTAGVPGGDVFAEFLWDDAGHLAGVTDQIGTSTIERDADGWVAAFTDQTGARVEIERDRAGRIVALRDDEAPFLERPGAVTDRRLDAARFDLARFDPAGRLLIDRDGTVYRYDEAGRPIEQAPVDGAPTSFEYGPDGLLAVERGPGGSRRFTHDAAGRVESITVRGLGATTIAYDEAGRRAVETHPDGSELAFGWNALDQLVEIRRTDPFGDTATVSVTVDALGRPCRVDVNADDRADRDEGVGGVDIAYQALTNTPSRIGDTRYLDAGGAVWSSADRRWGALAPGVPDGLSVAGLTVLGARVYDPATRQFLSPDPLHTVPGTNGGASAYTYAWQDPINHVDPTGMRPISIADYQAIREREEHGRVGQAWQAIQDDPWGTIAVVGLVGAAVLIGGPVGAGIALGMVATAGVGFATGTFSPTQVAIGGVVGGVTGGVGSVTSSTTSVLAAGGVVGAGSDLAGQAISGQPIDWNSVVVSGGVGVATAGIGGNANTTLARSALTGGAGDAVADVTYQVLTGDHQVDWNSVAVSAVTGTTTSTVAHRLLPAATNLDITPGYHSTDATSSVSFASDGFIDPMSVRFSQDSVSQNFSGGGPIHELTTSLRDGRTAPGDVPAIRIFENDGHWMTLDNRRLVAFQQAEVDVPYQVATPGEIGAQRWKMTTTNDGTSITIRGGGGTWPPETQKQ